MRGHRLRVGAAGMGDGDDGNPRLEPRSGPKLSLASKQRGSISRCERRVQNLFAQECAETPRAGGPGISSISAAQMRHSEMPYIGMNAANH